MLCGALRKKVIEFFLFFIIPLKIVHVSLWFVQRLYEGRHSVKYDLLHTTVSFFAPLKKKPEE